MVLVFAFYQFSPIRAPQELIKRHRALLQTLDAKGRIYVCEDGINGQMSIAEKEAETYLALLRKDFPDLDVKAHSHFEHAFAKMTIKYREQLAAIDVKVDMGKTGHHLSPKEWKSMLEKRDSQTLLLDVRNDYEWEIGHFEGAELPPLKQFREFPSYVKKLKERCDPKTTPVMMYCTGGIRCELFSAYMKEEGFDQVYQLDGGVIKYGLEEGDEHWKGKLFVFDDRMTVPIAPTNHEIISSCRHCQEPSHTYYNCANMDCNALFLACSACNDKMQGCCCDACTKAPRVRPYQKGENPKPFRKLTHLNKQA